MNNAALNTRWGTWIIEELARCGVPHICVVAGSRSTPLAAAAVEHSTLATSVFTDERSAAYFALGMGKATGQPAAVITTSGTATANLAPAVMEASAARVPLLLLTADRPPELRDTGANQTVEQVGLFGSRVRWSFDLPCPDDRVPLTALLTTIDQAVSRANGAPAGPVHLNCMFRQPLGPEETLDDTLSPEASAWISRSTPWTTYAAPCLTVGNDDLQALATTLSNPRRGLLVIGSLDDPQEQLAAASLARVLGWPVFADVTSGLRLTTDLEYAIDPYDALLASKSFTRRCRPDVIVQLGGAIVSRRFLDWRRGLESVRHLMIRPDAARLDPTHGVHWRLQAHLTALLPQLVPLLAPSCDMRWRSSLQKAAAAAIACLDNELPWAGPLNEPAVARSLTHSLTSATGLMISNSMPIRDVDVFGRRQADPPTVITNRGASGIDGIVATAAGWARGRNSAVTVLMGDQALLHDLNSLSLLGGHDQRVVVVVVNNGGGGIFSFLPIAKHPELLERAFAAAHDWTFGDIARSFGLQAYAPADLDTLNEALARAHADSGPSLIEVRTERGANRELHAQLLAAVTASVDQL